MRSTLFYIPYDWISLPGIGVGWLFIFWVILSLGIMAWLIRKQGWNQETASYLPFLVVIALVIAFFLPIMVEFAEAAKDEKIPLGIPVRGFGVMMMVAMLAGVGLAMYRGWQMGIDPEVMISLAMWMIFPGIVGARLFFIIENQGAFKTLMSLFDVTKGGLVVYGSVIGGLPFGVYYIFRRGLPVLATLDIIAPSMVVGAALGRIGCFLNGCCYGEECEWPIAVTFPAGVYPYSKDSPPYQHQHELGHLYGMKLKSTQDKWLPPAVIVQEVIPGNAAEQAGVVAGEEIAFINGKTIGSLLEAQIELGLASGSVELTMTNGKVHRIVRPDWPGRSLPIHPTQLYAALDAGLLALVLWVAYPFRRRDGEIFALLVTIYTITRFLIEIIRDDEPGQFGTWLTNGQCVSLGLFVAVAGLWYYVVQQPRGSVLPRNSNSE